MGVASLNHVSWICIALPSKKNSNVTLFWGIVKLDAVMSSRYLDVEVVTHSNRRVGDSLRSVIRSSTWSMTPLSP